MAGECSSAILCCGTGVGISMAANKVKGIRACCCTDYFSAKYTRLHNDANVLCMGERVIGAGLAIELVDVSLIQNLKAEDIKPALIKLWQLKRAKSFIDMIF